MAPESLAPAPCSSPSLDSNFPPLSASRSRKHGRPSVSRNPVARVSPGNPVPQMPAPSISSLYEHSKPPHPSPPPSSPSAIASRSFPTFLSSHVHSILANDSTAPIPSAPSSTCSATSVSVSGVRPSGLSLPPAPDVSRVAAEVPSLAGADQFDDLDEFVVADSGLSVGAQLCAIPGNRSDSELNGSYVTNDAVNSLQVGLPDSLDPDVLAGNPSGPSGSQVVHQKTHGGLPPSEKHLDFGPHGTQMVCPYPLLITVGDVVSGSNALNPVSGPSSSTSPPGKNQPQDEYEPIPDVVR